MEENLKFLRVNDRTPLVEDGSRGDGVEHGSDIDGDKEMETEEVGEEEGETSKDKETGEGETSKEKEVGEEGDEKSKDKETCEGDASIRKDWVKRKLMNQVKKYRRLTREKDPKM